MKEYDASGPAGAGPMQHAIELKLRNIFVGCLVLLVLLVGNLSYAVARQADAAAMVYSLVGLLLWAIVVTSYAFHALWRIARDRQKRIEELSHHDTATGVYSYEFIRRRIAEESDSMYRMHVDAAFGYFKLSGLEHVNDTYGHAVGNVVLREIANLAISNVPQHAMVGRLAGQEFCVLIPGADRSEAQGYMEQVVAGVRDYRVDLGRRGTIGGLGAAFGVAVLPNDGQELGELVRAARGDAMDRAARAV